METQRGGNVKSRGTVGRGFGVEWGRGEGRHASVPGHQLCEGRKRRKKRRRRRKSGEGGRKQHHASRSYIGGARADAAGKKTREREGGPMSILALLFSSWKRCWSNTFLDWWLISPESWWLLAKKETCGKTMKTFILCFENISCIFYFLITSLHLLPKFILWREFWSIFSFTLLKNQMARKKCVDAKTRKILAKFCQRQISLIQCYIFELSSLFQSHTPVRNRLFLLIHYVLICQVQATGALARGH